MSKTSKYVAAYQSNAPICGPAD